MKVCLGWDLIFIGYDSIDIGFLQLFIAPI